MRAINSKLGIYMQNPHRDDENYFSLFSD